MPRETKAFRRDAWRENERKMSIEQAAQAREAGEQSSEKSTDFPTQFFFLKSGYQRRSEPHYFEDNLTEKDQIIWQPDVYPFAAAIARRLRTKRIIDLGCGHAQKLVALTDEFATIGVDFGPNIAHCRTEHPTLRWIEANFESSDPVPCKAEESSDAIVICSDVVEHMKNPAALLDKISQLLTHASVAVISTPERDLTWGEDHAGPPPNPCHTMEWTLPEFVTLLQKAGFIVEFAGLTRSNDRDPIRKTIVAVVGKNPQRYLSLFGGTRDEFRTWLLDLNALSGDALKKPQAINAGPLVSVIVPTYNRPDWLPETLHSILNQSYRNFEIVVVNDAGPDISHIITPFNSDGRIKLVRHETNKGLAAARNTGVRAARGKYIAYLDDDDVFHPNHLATLVQCLNEKGCDVAYSDAYRATQEKEGDRYVVSKRDVPYSSDWDKDRILIHNFVPVLCFMHRRECIEKAGWFDETLTTHEDWDLWMRMSRQFKFQHIPQVTCEFRWREDGSSMSSSRRADFLRTAEIIYRKSSEFVAGRPEIQWKRQQHLLEISHSLGRIEKPTPDTLLVSIVIPVFNKLELTRACIEAIHRETLPGSFEMIVVDNASTDGTAEYLSAEQAAGRLRTIRNQANLGFSMACNQGMRAARGGFVLLLNNDTVPLPGWLQPMLDEFLIHENVGAVGSLLLYPGEELIQHAGVRIGAGGGNLHPYHPWRLQPWKNVPEATDSRDCQVVTGACLLLRKSVLEEVGLLDEGFINGFEDVDLCFRIVQAGHRVRYCGKSRVIHHESMTPGRNLHEQRNYHRLNERWKTIIQPDETPQATAYHGLEMQCRQRLITEPNNPRALAQIAEFCRKRNDLEQADQFLKRWNEVTKQGKDTPVSVSIVIPVFNNLKLTQQCLAAIANTAGLTVSEIIVVDNASTDGTAEFLAELTSSGALKAIRNESNLGFARACNQGAATARGRFVLFLNNDTVPTAGWIDFMVVAAHRSEVGVVGAKLLYPTGDIQHAGIAFINGIPDHPNRNAPAFTPEVNAFRELDMVTGACLLMPRDLFLDLAGFDETYRNGVEDIDLCLRARAAGYKVVYEPQAMVYHLEGQSVGRFDHVNENLKIFFARWQGSFDATFRFVTPTPPAKLAASSSILLKPKEHIVVSWEGSFLDHGSLSHVNRKLTERLDKIAGIQLERVNTNPGINTFSDLNLNAEAPKNPDVTVRLAWPPNWTRPRTGKLVVCQPWEFGVLPQQWVEQSEHVDEFWVPAEIVRKFYLDSGIPGSKVKLVPLGIDPKHFSPDAASRALPTKKKFRFLFVGGTIGRKGPDLLLKAYLRSFTSADDVCLVIKDFGGNSVYKGQTFEDEIRQTQAQPNAPEILYLNEELSPEEIPGLYTACDCLVHPYRGEGFGLPVLEAMACGLPVIVTAGGATDDFATDDVAYRIAAQKKFIGSEIAGLKLAGEGWLLEPDVNALAERMRWCLENSAEAKAKGRRASEKARGRWTWENSAQIGARASTDLHSRPLPQATHEKTKASANEPTVSQIGSLQTARELFGRRKLAEAWRETIAAIEVRPFHPEAFMQLAKIAVDAGDARAARAMAERARDLLPQWETARQFLRKSLKGNSRHDWLTLPTTNSKPRITVCIITRNEEQFIERCLSSIRTIASQLVVVDTGSTDKTVEIAKRVGAEVHPFSWCDDFSAARNYSLQHARGDWVLILDADEELPSEEHPKLLKDISDPRALALRLPLKNIGDEEGATFVPRLFRNTPKAHFTGRIHEQAFSSLVPLAKSWGMQIRLGTAEILHHGYSKAVTDSRAKVERNLRLLKLAISEQPGDPNLAMNLALELSRSGQIAESLAEYRKAFRLAAAVAPDQMAPEFRETLLTQFVTALVKNDAKDEALRVLNSVVARSGGLTASLHFTAGLLQFERKQFRAAAEEFRLCLQKRREKTHSPINKDIHTAAPHHCLALCLAQTGDKQAADKSFTNALDEAGDLGKVKLDYAKFLAETDRPIDALNLLYQIVSQNSQCLQAWQLGAQIATRKTELLEFANDWTREAVSNMPGTSELLVARAEILLLTEALEEAFQLLRGISLQQPAAKALLIASQILTGNSIAHVNQVEELAVSHAFIELYRRLIDLNAEGSILKINSRLEELESILPRAAAPLLAAVSEANNASVAA